MEVREDDDTFMNAVDHLFDDIEHGMKLIDENNKPILSDDKKPIRTTKGQPNAALSFY